MVCVIVEHMTSSMKGLARRMLVHQGYSLRRLSNLDTLDAHSLHLFTKLGTGQVARGFEAPVSRADDHLRVVEFDGVMCRPGAARSPAKN